MTRIFKALEISVFQSLFAESPLLSEVDTLFFGDQPSVGNLFCGRCTGVRVGRPCLVQKVLAKRRRLHLPWPEEARNVGGVGEEVDLLGLPRAQPLGIVANSPQVVAVSGAKLLGKYTGVACQIKRLVRDHRRSLMISMVFARHR